MSLHALALTLAVILGHPHASPELLGYAAEAVQVDRDPLFGGPEYELAVLVEWASKESGMQPEPRPQSHDARRGQSHGVLQQRLRLPISQQFTAWLATLHQARAMCGTDERALMMISSGYCDRAGGLVAARLDEAWLSLELAR